VLSLLAAGLLSFGLLSRWLAPMVSYAAGVLLAAAFLHLLPEAFSQADSIEGLFAVTLAGLLGFFLLEKPRCGATAMIMPGTAEATTTAPGC
jgi:zinc and cadmium transporter